MDFDPVAQPSDGDFEKLLAESRVMESKKESTLRFFQQNAWIGVATAAGGFFNLSVHRFAPELGKNAYGAYFALLQIWTLMNIPSLGLQAVFMQYAVSAEALGRRAVLAGAVRGALKLNLVLWMILAVIFLVFRDDAKRWFSISGSGALVIILLAPPISALLAVFNGVLQGEQNFPWYGGILIIGGFARLLFIAVLIFWLGPSAIHAAAGAFLGLVATCLVAGWQTRSIWREETVPFHWRPFLGKAIPITFALGSGVYLMSLDTVMVARFLPAQAGLYGAAGMVGKVLVPLSGSLLAVMFPKIVRSKALRQRTGALGLTLALTGFAAVSASCFLTLFPELPIRMIQTSEFLGAAPLVPWYCWSQIPLVLGAVLLYNLVARERYVAIPFLVLIACGYYWALDRALAAPGASLKQVIQIMGMAGLVFLAVTAFFTWVWREKAPAGVGGKDEG
jgi:O-antigen/teichoic acid export membrane protein